MSSPTQPTAAGKAGDAIFPDCLPFAYQVQRLLSHGPTGGAEINEVLYATERMTEGDEESWHTGWMWLADLARGDGDEALAAGHRVTARHRFFCAANYYRVAEFFLGPDDPRMLDTWRLMANSFRKAGELSDPPFEWIEWPYEDGKTLPGYLAKPKGASGRLPTVVYLNGADGTKEESWFSGGRLLVDRGVNFVGIEGPGQGAPLRLDRLYTRPDYEKAVSPLLDQLAERPDVDPGRIALVGVSMGGYYAARIAAYEPRFKCVALHGACFNAHDDLYENFPPIRPQLQWVTGTFDDPAARARLKELDLAGHLHNLRAPVLITHGADDVLVHPGAARKTFQELGGNEKTLHVWSERERGIGGGIHCSQDNATQAYPEIADWVVDQLTR